MTCNAKSYNYNIIYKNGPWYFYFVIKCFIKLATAAKLQI
jgi:hypothetical protein